jgi:transcriptional regulator with XRE-family HTH domain
MRPGERIAHYINSHDMTPSLLAKRSGLTQSEISDILADKPIDTISYYKICKVLNVPLEYFLED